MVEYITYLETGSGSDIASFEPSVRIRKVRLLEILCLVKVSCNLTNSD